MTRKKYIWIVGLLVICVWIAAAYAQSPGFKENIYQVGKLKPTDSVLKVKVGDLAPDFTLPAVRGEKTTLSQYRGKKKRSNILCPRCLDTSVL
jgi:peroxiredoxin (alkyl hydroperoxide reductase subunit C)